MISSSQTRLSYKDRKSHRRQRVRFIFILILCVVIHIIVTGFLMSPWIVESQSMLPGISPNTRMMVVSYLRRDKEGHLQSPPSRGDIIAIRPPYMPKTPQTLVVINSIVRFFTLQKYSLDWKQKGRWQNDQVFKRVIGVPGDTIRIKKSIAYVKEANEDFFLSEFEKSGIGYDVKIQKLPEKWDEHFPLNDSMEEFVLDKHEYFVLGDNRRSSNDSRYWGAISDKIIQGKAIFAYWPLKSFGKIR